MISLFEVDNEPVCIMEICLRGCMIIGHLALYARQGNPMVTLCSIIVIKQFLCFCCMLLVGGAKPRAFTEVNEKDVN